MPSYTHLDGHFKKGTVTSVGEEKLDPYTLQMKI